MRLCFSLIIVLFILLPHNFIFAEAAEKISAEDKIIAATFKTLAKGFVLVMDFKKLKEGNIKKIYQMEGEKFQKRYAKAYDVMKDLPAQLKDNYKITENMTKEQVIENIRSLDKGKAYEIIDAIPDTIIASRFKQYLSEKKQELRESKLVIEINKLWDKTIRKIQSPPKAAKK